MLYGMYISAAGAMANSYRQDVITNNLANIDTAAFKKDLALFNARPTEAAMNGSARMTSALLENTGGGIFALPTYTDFSQGSLEQTGSAFDVALIEDGFFQVQKGDQTMFTRDGRFMVGADGTTLVTVTGQLPVLNAEGETISLLPGITPKIDNNGYISQDGQAITKIGTVSFQDNSQLKKIGNNLYEGEIRQATPSTIQLRQGYIESSGVNAMDEITNMIKTQRLFQNNVTMLQIQDQTLGAAISKLGNIR
ncbi:MAG: flagellar hook-basal body protein [Dehalococcoidales bacterium]|nr:flagellar hook-basal body protein [Dehalococcoidales bacterium]